MKSTIFTGRQFELGSTNTGEGVTQVVVPTLSAYAVEHSEFTPPPNLDTGPTVLYQDSHYRIEGDNVFLAHPFCTPFGGLEPCRLVIHYHGIRDYALLFPQITDQRLKERLGRFYEEAEVAFDNHAWLSFALMAGAVYEGLLGWRLKSTKKSFDELIQLSQKQGVLSQSESDVLHDARQNRNLIHADRSTEAWMTRARAMDMRLVMDRLIRQLSIESDVAELAATASEQSRTPSVE